MRRLRLHHPPTLLTLGVIHRNTTLAAFDKDDQINDHRRQNENAKQNQNADLTLPRLLKRLANSGRQPSNNTCKDQQGDAVTHAALGDLLTQPHHEHSPGHQ